MSEHDLQVVEVSIEQAKKAIKLGDSVDRLLKSRDFKAVITEGYFEQEAIRLVHAKAHPEMDNPNSQASIIGQMDSIGHLYAHLNLLRGLAQQARKSMNEYENTREEILAESV